MQRVGGYKNIRPGTAGRKVLGPVGRVKLFFGSQPFDNTEPTPATAAALTVSSWDWDDGWHESDLERTVELPRRPLSFSFHWKIKGPKKNSPEQHNQKS